MAPKVLRCGQTEKKNEEECKDIDDDDGWL